MLRNKRRIIASRRRRSGRNGQIFTILVLVVILLSDVWCSIPESLRWLLVCTFLSLCDETDPSLLLALCSVMNSGELYDDDRDELVVLAGGDPSLNSTTFVFLVTIFLESLQKVNCWTPKHRPILDNCQCKAMKSSSLEGISFFEHYTWYKYSWSEWLCELRL